MAKKSKLEEKVEKAIKEAFPNRPLKSQQTIKKGDKTFKVDFVLCGGPLDVAFEVHGQQHFEYTPFFHGDQAGWMEQVRRDEDKYEALLEVGVPYIEIFYNDTLNKEILHRKVSAALDLVQRTQKPFGKNETYYQILESVKNKRQAYYLQAISEGKQRK
ncbi:MAG: hypothetical protein WC476_01390 [Phycisphaerae bacterium]|jgi:hypothetical protein